MIVEARRRACLARLRHTCDSTNGRSGKEFMKREEERREGGGDRCALAGEDHEEGAGQRNSPMAEEDVSSPGRGGGCLRQPNSCGGAGIRWWFVAVALGM